jgi:N-acetylglucosaminyldiphosphoundecaprenol N-acetyl-beta-D-mannosaminyltransferase
VIKPARESETDLIVIDEAAASDSPRKHRFLRVLGVPICAVTMSDALTIVDEAIRTRSPLHIGVVNAAKVVNMQRDARLSAAVLASDVIFADGMAVVWASRLFGVPLPERVTGIDLMMGILDRGSERRHKVYCLGATEEISARCAAVIARDFPGIRLVGRHHGYYGSEGEARVVQDIAACNPDVLFVAMTSPKKEEFLARWGSKLNATVTHGVGGSFDVLAGKVERAPESWRKFGLEWLYRVKQEPRRLWKRYLVTNSIFCWLVIKALFGKRT